MNGRRGAVKRGEARKHVYKVLQTLLHSGLYLQTGLLGILSYSHLFATGKEDGTNKRFQFGTPEIES